MDLRKDVSTIDKISLLARQHYIYDYTSSTAQGSGGSFRIGNL